MSRTFFRLIAPLSGYRYMHILPRMSAYWIYRYIHVLCIKMFVRPYVYKTLHKSYIKFYKFVVATVFPLKKWRFLCFACNITGHIPEIVHSFHTFTSRQTTQVIHFYKGYGIPFGLFPPSVHAHLQLTLRKQLCELVKCVTNLTNLTKITHEIAFDKLWLVELS